MARALWLVLACCGGGATSTKVAPPIQTEDLARPGEEVVAATERLDMRLPGPTKPFPNPTVTANAAVAYELADEVVVHVQRSVLDGACAWELDREVSGIAELAVQRERIAGVDAIVAFSNEKSIVAVTTCHGPELLVITAASPKSGMNEVMRAIAVRAAETMRPTSRPFATTARVPIGPTLAVELPTPVRLLGEENGKRFYETPGVRGLVIEELQPRSATECAVWLATQQRDLETENGNAKLVYDRVDRVSAGGKPLVLGDGRQLGGTSGVHANAWYTNIAGAFCADGTPVLLFAISFEGATFQGKPPATTTARLRELITRAVPTIAPL